MSRYFTLRCKSASACGWVERDYAIKDGEPLIPACDVDTRGPIDTGLITVTGEAIMRTPNPVGFGRDEDW